MKLIKNIQNYLEKFKKIFIKKLYQVIKLILKNYQMKKKMKFIIKKKISKETYNKLKEDNKIKPKWNKNTITIIKETINNYIQSIFNGKQFKNEIVQEDFIYKAIPKELIKNQEISKDKMNEINNVT